MSKVLNLWETLTGAVVGYSLGTPPSGWLACDGSELEPGTADNLRSALIAADNPHGSANGNPLLPDQPGHIIRSQ